MAVTRQRKASKKKVAAAAAAAAAVAAPAGASSPEPVVPPRRNSSDGSGGSGGSGDEDEVLYEEIGGRVKAEDGTWISWELVRPVPRAGQAKSPLLVTVNGLSNDGYQWQGLMPVLRKDHAVLSWDFRGHGCSENPRDVSAVSIPSLAADMEAVMLNVGARSLASTNHVTVVAYSMGCQVALEWCRGHSQRVAVRGGYNHQGGRGVGMLSFCLVC